MASKKTVLITDLDNTLFDWVELWLNCFSAMLDGIVEISGISKEQLIPEIAAVHQKHGTSEYSFLIEEIPSLKPLLKGRPATTVFAKPIEKYQLERRKHLHLYPTVAETLLKIKGRGTKIIGYTESMAFYSNYRVRRLGLDGILDYMFSPEDHMIPEGLSTEDLRKYPAEHYKLKYTKQHFTPKGSKKPDTKVLNAIIADLGLNKADCVYVGDSLMKDVAMAGDCGIEDVWAKYGEAHKRPEYKLLQDVTHWTAEEVAREQRIRARKDVHPTHTLENTYSEIWELFDFRDFHNDEPKLGDKQRKQIIDIWKTVIEVQQHFNDISMRIRAMFVTILLGLFAAIGFLLDKPLLFKIGIFKIQFATILPIYGILGTYLFYFMDRHWYHRLLLGSVKHGAKIENKYQDEMPELSLTKAIGDESPYKPNRIVRWLAKPLVRHKKYRETGQLHSEGKIELFYNSVAVVLGLTTFILAIFGGVTTGEKMLPAASVITTAPTLSPVVPAPVPNTAPPSSELTAPASPATAPAPPVAPAAVPDITPPSSEQGAPAAPLMPSAPQQPH